jgi:hypothetical protein
MVEPSFEYDEPKFTELLLHVAEKLRDDPAGGATKLNKVLFFAEFASVRALGRPITGAEFQKLERGPAPRRLLAVRQALESQGHARVESERYLGYSQHRLIPLRDADLSVFDDEELAIIDQALGELHGRSATAVSDLSQEHPGWQLVEDGETIPYSTAYLTPAVATARVRERAAELAADLPSR